MTTFSPSCLVCGDELVYFEQSRDMECSYCHKTKPSNAACSNGHFVCDECHTAKALEKIKHMCLNSIEKNPYQIAVSMMKDPFIYMHGPEHHVLIGSALLTAYHNAGGQVELEPAINEMIKRGSQVPGGICGFWGCCGAAVSSGIFISIITGSTPLKQENYGLCNLMTAEILNAIAAVGGPRCCKRNGFLAIQQAVKFCRENLHVKMEEPERYICEFSPRNNECIGQRCPYLPRC